MFLPQFPKVEKASPEQVDVAHKQYMAALASLYLKHNPDESVSLVITWMFKFMECFSFEQANEEWG